MKGHMGPEKGDGKIATRLVPQLVFDSGAIRDLNEFDVSVDKNSYDLLYIIWGSHQRHRFQNKDMGYLGLSFRRKNNEVSVRVSKVLVTHDNLNQHVEIDMKMNDDDMLTPVSYAYSSRITDNALCERPELSLDRSGYVKENQVVEMINGTGYRRSFGGSLLFDFSVYDMVLRSFEAGDFIYYENLYAMKEGNRLDISDRTYEVEGIPLEMMIHRGRALTERRFYKNSNGVPVMMIQNSAAYILDSTAGERVEKLKDELNTGGFHYEY